MQKPCNNSEEIIQIDSLNQILINIGHPEATFTNEDLNVLLSDDTDGLDSTSTKVMKKGSAENSAADNRSIPISALIQLL